MLQTHPLRGYIEKTMLKHSALYDSVGAVLHQLFFVNGNGIYVDDTTGMLKTRDYIEDLGQYHYYYLHEVPVMNEQERTAYAEAIYQSKVRRIRDMRIAFEEGMAEQGFPVEPTTRDAASDEPYPQFFAVQTEMLGVAALTAELMEGEADNVPANQVLCRPHFDAHSAVCKLNAATPAWLVETARNVCLAWHSYVVREVEHKHFGHTEYDNENSTIDLAEKLTQEVARLDQLLQSAPRETPFTEPLTSLC